MGDDEDDEATTKTSIAEMAENGNGHVDDEDAGEMFPLGSLTGDNLTLAKILKGTPDELTVSLRSAEVPVTGGLLDPRNFGRVLVTYEVEKVENVILRKEGEMTGWKAREVLRPTYVSDANNLDALVISEFSKIVQTDAQAAARVHETLAGILKDALKS